MIKGCLFCLVYTDIGGCTALLGRFCILRSRRVFNLFCLLVIFLRNLLIVFLSCYFCCVYILFAVGRLAGLCSCVLLIIPVSGFLPVCRSCSGLLFYLFFQNYSVFSSDRILVLSISYIEFNIIYVLTFVVFQFACHACDFFFLNTCIKNGKVFCCLFIN